MIRIAMLSKWHVHAAGYASEVQSMPDACITCVWDEDVARGQAWARELDVDFESDLDALLLRDDVEAVIIDTPTTDHLQVMLAVARAGKHIFTEKVMAPKLADCKKISESVRENGVKFCISYPNLATSVVQFTRQAIDDGLLGQVHYMRMRRAHDGSLRGWLPEYWYDLEKAGGGAMMDLGCHPMYTASYLLGRPQRISAMFNNNYAPAPLDDNSVALVEFANKAIAVLETSFISPWSPDYLEVLGTEGAVIAIDGKLKYRSTSLPVEGWITPDKLPDPRPVPLRQWLDGIISGRPIEYGTAMGEALTELLENAYLSHEKQETIMVDS